MRNFYFLFLLINVSVFAQLGSLCENPIVIGSLPYTTTDNTANYADNYDPQTVTHPTCSTTTFGNYYHGGNDVIYSYTAAVTGTIKVEIPSAIGWTGMFIYYNCADIGITYAACATGTAVGPRTINNFAVTAGQTYYIFISSWPLPQTVAYTLNVTDPNLGVDNPISKNEVSIYPNPTSSDLFFDTSLSIQNVKIYAANGQLVATSLRHVQNDNVVKNSISVAHLPVGFYLIELQTTDGIIINKNFVKK